MMIFFVIVLSVVGVLGVRRWMQHRDVQNLLSSRLTEEERAIVAEYVPTTQRLPDELNAQLEGKVLRFLHQVDFIGCDGLEITDEMQLSIAAQACLLIVNSDAWYKHLRTILVYPGAFSSLREERNGYVVQERRTVRLGESWSRGPVVLSWAHSEQGGLNDRDGHNVVLHEFAHQLDDLSGYTDGLPVLRRDQKVVDWARVFTTRFDVHVDQVERGRKTFLDPYGATGPEEFFAVSIEAFFEKPEGLKEHEPEVFAQLVQLLNVDPMGWG